MLAATIHPSNRVEIEGAVFESPYAGRTRWRPAAVWLGLHDREPRAGLAVRQARDGEERASFRGLNGIRPA